MNAPLGMSEQIALARKQVLSGQIDKAVALHGGEQFRPLLETVFSENGEKIFIAALGALSGLLKHEHQIDLQHIRIFNELLLEVIEMHLSYMESVHRPGGKYE